MKPMLAATLEKLEDVQFPVYVSPKLDGIRCLIHNGVAVSRALKPIPNKYIQEQLKGLSNGLDGELMLHRGDFNAVQSAILSEDGEPDFYYAVFDIILDKPFEDRLRIINKRVVPKAIYFGAIKVYSIDELQDKENYAIDDGYEGIMLRSPNSPYKFGRSTVKEGYLLKYKRFKDDEAIITGFVEELHNENVAEKDNLGHTKRSSKKAFLKPMQTLGSLSVVWNDKNFSIGTGFDAAMRKEIWNNQDKFLGKSVTFKYQELSKYGIPRFPTFKGFRLENI